MILSGYKLFDMYSVGGVRLGKAPASWLCFDVLGGVLFRLFLNKIEKLMSTQKLPSNSIENFVSKLQTKYYIGVNCVAGDRELEAPSL